MGLEVKTAYTLAADLLASESKNKSTKVQRRIFAARQTAIDVENARDADDKIARAWVLVLYLNNSNADVHNFQNITTKAQASFQTSNMDSHFLYRETRSRLLKDQCRARFPKLGHVQLYQGKPRSLESGKPYFTCIETENFSRHLMSILEHSSKMRTSKRIDEEGTQTRAKILCRETISLSNWSDDYINILHGQGDHWLSSKDRFRFSDILNEYVDGDGSGVPTAFPILTVQCKKELDRRAEVDKYTHSAF